MGMDTITVLLFFALIVWFLLSELKILILIALLLLSMFLRMPLFGGSDYSSPEATKTVNDLRHLKSAGLLFRSEQSRWLMPGEEASLDAYLDLPIVTAEWKRFANIMLSEELRVESGNVHQYVGGELIPGSDGTDPIRVQKKLASKAKESGLFQEVRSGDVTSFDIYRSGLKVFMQVR